MNVYRLLQLNRRVKNYRIKFLGLYLLHKFNKRYLAVNLDPVLACNLRCKMCYFTDADYVKTLKGQFEPKELKAVADAIFGRALKLQIGCGTEPTLYKNLPDLVSLGKKYNVPYISLTTNANLLTKEKIEELLKAGLHEFTISLHGVTKETYEGFMKKASYEKFHDAFKAFAELKAMYDFKVRINYTFNKDNFYELRDFFEHFDPKSFDILQIRPIQKIGNTEYNDFDISALEDDYPKVVKGIKDTCKAYGITVLAPEELSVLKGENQASFIFDYTFCYVSPKQFWKEGFNWRETSFNEFSKEIGWSSTLLTNVFRSKKTLKSLSNKLNYEIEF
ncbi:radical SAM protein [Mangrovimonas sp. YM274]|uniref:radical SAM protein n=1 Tax=Mangrovimonas sp. YM274 TaxID=3070660 RepID=UPI0027DB1D72|nr:radical SAM protein [Mangrovimonas sp. YM274]WMI68873.1 radical SAM protein [Mangrovimonas sp. YM274]